MSKIVVSSSVTRAFPPDMVNFNIHISKIGENSRELVKYNKATIDELFSKMNELMIEEDNLRESSFRIVVNREYVDNEYRENGYKLDSNYVLTNYIDYELMDGIRQALTDLDLEFNVTYDLEDEDKIRDELLTEAVKKSKAKAKIIAAAAGAVVGEVKEVRYGEVNGSRPMLMRASVSDDGREALPRDIEITESVEVEWGIE